MMDLAKLRYASQLQEGAGCNVATKFGNTRYESSVPDVRTRGRRVGVSFVSQKINNVFFGQHRYIGDEDISTEYFYRIFLKDIYLANV